MDSGLKSEPSKIIDSRDERKNKKPLEEKERHAKKVRKGMCDNYC